MSGQEVKWSWGRVLRRAALCVCVGLMLNAAVATGCFLYAPVRMSVNRGGFSSDDVKGAPPASVVFKAGDVYRGFGVQSCMNYWIWSDTPGAVMGAGIADYAAGWPFRAFETPVPPFGGVHDFATYQSVRDDTYGLPDTTALPAFLHAQKYRAYPTRIRPLAFAANSALYTGLAAGVLIAWPAFRTARRRRAGKCVPCGYPLGQLERCPECGWARFLRRIARMLGQGVQV